MVSFTMLSAANRGAGKSYSLFKPLPAVRVSCLVRWALSCLLLVVVVKSLNFMCSGTHASVLDSSAVARGARGGIAEDGR